MVDRRRCPGGGSPAEQVVTGEGGEVFTRCPSCRRILHVALVLGTVWRHQRQIGTDSMATQQVQMEEGFGELLPWDETEKGGMLRSQTIELYMNHTGGIELARTEKGFATWAVNPEGNRFWGHYFESFHGEPPRFEEAREDFIERLNREMTNLSGVLKYKFSPEEFHESG